MLRAERVPLTGVALWHAASLQKDQRPYTKVVCNAISNKF